MNTTMQQLLDRLVPQIQELYKKANIAYWDSTTTGSKEDEDAYSTYKAELLKLYADRETYAELKQLQADGNVTDPLLARQLDILIHQFAQQQIDPADIDEMVKRETEIESLFTAFRATVGNEKVSDNTIYDILANERDNGKRREAWEASKQIGALVGDKVLSLVGFRNEIARKLGYDNYYSMSLHLQEIEEEELFSVLGALEQATGAPFATVKRELDEDLSAHYGITPEEMRPWHYTDPFFQGAPASADANLDRYFEGKDVVALSKVFFDGIDLEIQDILDRSDLYEREGKNQHAYCTDIDREGDVRMLCNVRDNEYWASTMLHELGHAVYDKYHDEDLPWLLREPAHTLTTEAIAMLFGRLTRNADWLHKIAGVPLAEAEKLEEAIDAQLTLSMLVFIRWGLVMTHFEREMYKNPEQDLNTLWWDYVERFQLVTRPEHRNQPDWASKIHLGTAPVYYQNYILGELTASQLLAAINRDLGITAITGEKQVAAWLVNKVFKPGARDPWNTLIEKATGEKLTAEAFVSQFVKA